MIRIHKLLILIILLTGAYNFAQIDESEIVARAGDKVITKNEFLERYEFTPGIKRPNKSKSETSEINFLYTLIAEKLWAQEAENLHLDTTEVIRFSKEEFEKLFVRDALYRKEITNKIKITKDELKQGYLRNTSNLKVKFLFSESKNEIDNLYSMLNDGIEFDSVLSVRPENDEQPEPVEVVYGQMESAVEDSLYQLKPGEYTTPILTPDGWYIFKVVNRIEKVIKTAEEMNEQHSAVEKIIKARKSRKLYQKFYSDFFNGKKVDVNPVLFESLAEKLSNRFKWNKKDLKIEDGKPIHFLSDDVLFIEHQFGDDSLKQIYIDFKNNPVSLKKFIRMLAFDGFSSEEDGIVYMRKLLDVTTKQKIEQELLAREGIRRGYQLLPEVQGEVRMWIDNYEFQVLKDKFLDSVSVSEDEVYKYYKSIEKKETYPEMVNIIEVLTDSLETARRILKEINDGKDIKELAAKYTKREWAKKRMGEFGLFPVMDYGEIGRVAATMKIGDVYGPLKVPEGYSIFKLIDKKDSVTINPKPFDAVKDDYRNELTYKKLHAKMINYTTSLALKYGVSIDYKTLNSIKVTNINSFAIRRMGFGGKMTAVPLLAPNNEWVQPWLNKLEVVQ